MILKNCPCISLSNVEGSIAVGNFKAKFFSRVPQTLLK